MQPNQNIQDNTGGVSATNGTFNTNNTPEPPKENIMTVGAKKEKSSKGMLLGLILFAVLAVGGIGFGVWAMLDGNTRADNLNSQISTLRSQNSELMEQLGQTSTGNGDTVINIDTNTDIDTADYIYVGEWGLKIKIPEGLNIEDYAFSTEATVGGPVTKIDVGLENGDYGEYYLGTVVRTPKSSYNDSSEQPYKPAFSDDEYYYIVSHPNGDVPASLQLELELISDMLSNSENYSKI